MTTASEEGRFTEGPIAWPLLALAGPLMATQLLQVAYNLTDTFWVGRIGSDAVTALSFSWHLLFLLVSLGAGMTNAGTILVAQHAGAGNDDRLGRVAVVALVVVLALGASGVWYAIALSNITAAVVGAYIFVRGYWLGDVIDREPTAGPGT